MYDMGDARVKLVAMPKDTNPHGNIFGGWIMSQIDIAGSIAVGDITYDRRVTVGADSIVFKQPVFVGDIVNCYAKITKVGRSSIAVQVEVAAERRQSETGECVHVASATLTYVVLDKHGHKKRVDTDTKRLQELGLR